MPVVARACAGATRARDAFERGCQCWISRAAASGMRRRDATADARARERTRGSLNG